MSDHVYRLNRSIDMGGKVHMTGGASGELYATLSSAMKAVQAPVQWTKRDYKPGFPSVWESDKSDLIVQVKVRP